MVTIRIGGTQRTLDEHYESWINQQIVARRQAGEPVCVVVSIEEDGLRMHLSTPGCGNGSVGGRPPNRQESAVLSLWQRHGLNADTFSGGDLIAFLKQLSRML